VAQVLPLTVLGANKVATSMAAGTCLTHHLFAKLSTGETTLFARNKPSIDFWTWQKLPQKEKAL